MFTCSWTFFFFAAMIALLISVSIFTELDTTYTRISGVGSCTLLLSKRNIRCTKRPPLYDTALQIGNARHCGSGVLPNLPFDSVQTKPRYVGLVVPQCIRKSRAAIACFRVFVLSSAQLLPGLRSPTLISPSSAAPGLALTFPSFSAYAGSLCALHLGVVV